MHESGVPPPTIQKAGNNIAEAGYSLYAVTQRVSCDAYVQSASCDARRLS